MKKTCAKCGKNMFRKKAGATWLNLVLCLECFYRGWYFDNNGEVCHSQH